MRILVNGKPAEIPEGITVQALLESKNLPPGSVAIALNGSIAPADQWGTIRLKPGDEVDLVRHVGGG